MPEPSHVVVALGSGGTSAGLLAGFRLAGLPSRLVCVLVSDVAPRITRLARRTLSLLGRHGVDLDATAPSPTGLDIRRGWRGAGYGRATPEGERATRLLAERAGVALDQVYTSKAGAALLQLNRHGTFGDGPVLCWHTYSPPDSVSRAEERGGTSGGVH
jgi:D-cysteine desulfhydrase